eukprot:CAMPEP_0115126940 /NCGR_PEP_ID=MMETSP0227-20121206/50070_1 /TAXON_ID=89957 /ORGANISM="Polarella glacialis, Strain CCMP 1383" /LENGTH=138 /DNA_ID=CAMNT_0002530865 /DNA_START=113 /DNA_END=527 /DNA_ORIENTATION=+
MASADADIAADNLRCLAAVCRHHAKDIRCRSAVTHWHRTRAEHPHRAEVPRAAMPRLSALAAASCRKRFERAPAAAAEASPQSASAAKPELRFGSARRLLRAGAVLRRPPSPVGVGAPGVAKRQMGEEAKRAGDEAVS